jgi:hypothetical protein
MGMSHWRDRHNGMMARSMTRSLAKSRSRALPRAGAIAACFNRGVYLGSVRWRRQQTPALRAYRDDLAAATKLVAAKVQVQDLTGE